MTRIYKRQRKMYLFAGIVSTIAIVNVLFFLILYRPTRSEYFRLQESIGRLRSQIVSQQLKVDQKEKMVAQLETSNEDRQALFTKHFIPLSVGFAKVLPQLDQLAQKTGVKKSDVDYGREQTAEHGLFSVKIKIPVQGSYSNIVNFIKELENSATTYIITSIDVRSSGENAFQPTAGNISLSFGLETYFYQ